MNLTSKSRYALKILMDLACHADEPHVDRQDIAKRQGITTTYLDQIMLRLKRSSLIKSVRGRGGGYSLARPAIEINVWEIFQSVEDSVHPVQCVELGNCEFEARCGTKQAWNHIYESFRAPLLAMTLHELVSRWPIEKNDFATEVKECRAGTNMRRAATKGTMING